MGEWESKKLGPKAAPLSHNGISFRDSQKNLSLNSLRESNEAGFLHVRRYIPWQPNGSLQLCRAERRWGSR